MDTAQAYVWRLQNFVIGEHILKPCPENPTPVKVILLVYRTILHFNALLLCYYYLKRLLVLKKKKNWKLYQVSAFSYFLGSKGFLYEITLFDWDSNTLLVFNFIKNLTNPTSSASHCLTEVDLSAFLFLLQMLG